MVIVIVIWTLPIILHRSTVNSSHVDSVSSGNASESPWTRKRLRLGQSRDVTPNYKTLQYQFHTERVDQGFPREGGWLKEWHHKQRKTQGDFSVRAFECRMPHMDARGRLTLEKVALADLPVVSKFGTTTTFRRPGRTETCPDVSLASELLIPRIQS